MTSSLFSRYLSSEFAVKAFFAVSGYLIFRSYEASSFSADYFEKRARRIYPAYAAVVLICAFGGVLFRQVSPSEYFSTA